MTGLPAEASEEEKGVYAKTAVEAEKKPHRED